MRKICIAQSKGGVGKTTTAISLSHGLSLRGYRVLLIDCDVQNHCARALGVNSNDGLYQLIEEQRNTIVEARERLFLLSSGKRTVALKKAISLKDMAPEETLAEALLPFENKYNYAILDTAPSWDVLNVNALVYSRDIIAPISMEALTLSGFVDFNEDILRIQKHNKELRLSWILPTFYDRRVKKSDEIYNDLKLHFGEKVLAPIRYNVRLSECVRSGKTIFEYDMRSSGARDYANLIRVVDNGKA